jgi:hypothetical protein
VRVCIEIGIAVSRACSSEIPRRRIFSTASDIDILLHFKGTDQQRQQLLFWLEGWSRCLSEINFFRTGYRTDGLLDVHLITDEDISARTSFAAKIGAITDPARKLQLKK